jgi:hypothetical protein
MEIKFYDKNISPEDLEEAMEDFKEKKNFEKIKDVADFAAQMRQARQNDLKLLEGNVTSKAAASKDTFAKSIQEAETELNGNYKDQVFFGVTITEDVTRRVLNSIRQNGVSFTRPDGTPDVHKAIQTTLREEYFPDMLQAAFDRGLRTASKKEAIKRSKPLTGLKARTGIVASPTLSRKDRLEKAWQDKQGTKA